jgi:signal transduction histidine kinase
VFGAFVGRIAASQSFLGNAERREIKRAIVARLAEEGVEDVRKYANWIMDIGLREVDENALRLLRHAHRDELLRLAYDLASLEANTRVTQQAVDQCSKVVFALKNYARSEPHQEMQCVALAEGIQTVLDLYSAQFKRGIKLQCQLEGAPILRCYPDELIQVWTNLIHNALQAMEEAGSLEISCEGGAQFIRVRITDSGPGIPEDIRNKIFEPFFTTKARGEGTGLGLHICQQILAHHGGEIGVESLPGRTCFTVSLPASLLK